MSVLLVVPCFNEYDRWDFDYWKALVSPGTLDVLFVNDGSSDATSSALRSTVESTGARMLELESNVGKAEAVRHGLLHANAQHCDLVGYLDADGAFPSPEVRRLANFATDLLAGDSPDFEAVWSARILMAGREIERTSQRHYLGRIITTIIAPWHGYPIYDTQSGYKLFRMNESFTACLQEPFRTRWFPDVELLQRWKHLNGRPLRIWEEPVSGWRDVAGSKMNARQYRQILRDLSHIYRSRTVQ